MTFYYRDDIDEPKGNFGHKIIKHGSGSELLGLSIGSGIPTMINFGLLSK